MPVVIDHGVAPEGIQLGPIISEPNRVRVQGASSRLQNVRTVEGRIVVDASGINIDEDVAVEAFDEDGAIVPGISIDPASVRVRATVARQLAYATLPVIPELVGEPAHGRRVDNVSVVPATITVSGESADIRQLESVATGPVDISGADIELVSEVPLVLPQEMTSPGTETVTVLVTFTDAVASRAYEVGTALVGARPDLTYRVEEPAVSVVIAGPVGLLDELADGQLVAEVPAADLQVGDNAVVPVVRTPAGASVVRVTPETVRVTVAPPS
jgi:YbbR domain-containing protein